VFASKQIKLEWLVEAAWNANRVPAGTLRKLRRSLEQFGVVEDLVARPHPELPGRFEVLSGNHRLRLLHELGYRTAPVVLVELDDARARLLAQTLNRTRGSDDRKAYAVASCASGRPVPDSQRELRRSFPFPAGRKSTGTTTTRRP